MPLQFHLPRILRKRVSRSCRAVELKKREILVTIACSAEIWLRLGRVRSDPGSGFQMGKIGFPMARQPQDL